MSAGNAVKPSTQTPVRPDWSRLSLQTPRDPGYAALRRASRAALVISVAFAFSTLVLHNAQNVIFVIFGCFALLVLADFGGVRRPRAIAYLTATLVGAVLVALATLASGNAVLAAAQCSWPASRFRSAASSVVTSRRPRPACCSRS